jgi:hypothetical protein
MLLREDAVEDNESKARTGNSLSINSRYFSITLLWDMLFLTRLSFALRDHNLQLLR